MSQLFLAVNKTVTNWADMSVLGMLRNFLLLPTDVPANIMPILPVAWTLTYEILFYLLFGLALMVRRTYALVVLAIWVILILARFLNFIEPSSPTTFLYILSNS